MSKSSFSRRVFLKFSGVAGIGLGAAALLVGCASGSTSASGSNGSSGSDAIDSGTVDPASYGSNVQAIKDKGVLTMATGTYVPFEYRDENNNIVGFDVDLA